MAAVFPASQAIVLGGGLAGVSAANTVLECGGNVVLLDKSSFCGGNSTKATSGINGANTRTQRMKGVFDSNEIFNADTLRGGAKKPEIVKVLCDNSGPDVEWLMDKFDLDLSLVARLGGHSQPRTHRGAERFPGMTITYALIQMLEKVAEHTNNTKARIVCKAKATKFLMSGKETCCGVEYEFNGQTLQEHGPVIVCTGGFGADFTSSGLLAKYRPDLLHLPTTNGEHCTGDGIKMGAEVGGATIDLEWVQVHPTGLVKPDDADAKVKFLAAEALRGVGGVLIDREGKRFANELGRRDYVTGRMWKNKPPFRLCLNSKAAKEIHWHCEHYKGRGVMKFFQTARDLTTEMDINPAVLEQTFNSYNTIAAKQAEDPDGGPYDAYGGGKSWDEWGKKYFHNLPLIMDDEFHVAIVTPVIHYCMGGLEIDSNSQVVNTAGRPIKGLYAAGEIAGGVHGNNRLGGNSLLDCVVFGRVSGKHCAEYMLGEIKPTSLALISGKVGAGKGSAPAAAAAGGDAAPAAAASAGASYSMEEVANHTTKESCWVVLDGKVLDVTNFLPDHPGGELAILTFGGKDATAEFNMIHPPDVIGKYAPDAVIGDVGGGGAPAGGSAAAPAASGGAAAPLLSKPGGEEPGMLMGCYYMIYAFLHEIISTIFTAVPIKVVADRTGLTRSAFFLIMFIVIHAVGNLHVFLGPDDFNGYGYFYVRLYWTGFGFNANIVEEYVLLSAIMHVAIALKRTYDITTGYTIKSGKWNLAITGILLLVYMTIHLFQFRFGATQPYAVRPPPFLINFEGVNPLSDQFLHLFYTIDQSVPVVEVRDIYKLEFDLFQSPFWVVYYCFSVFVFLAHYCWGWQKVIPSSQLGIPKPYHFFIQLIGYAIGVVIAFCYLAFPLYCYFIGPSNGVMGQI